MSIPDHVLLRSMVAAWDDERLFRLALSKHIQPPANPTRAEILDALTEDAHSCRAIIEYLEDKVRARADEPAPEGAITRAEMIGLRLVEDEDDS